MKHRVYLAAALCAALSLGYTSAALADEEEGATIMEGTSAVMVRLEPGTQQQEVVIPVGSEVNVPGADGDPARQIRHIQALLRTGDAPTLALATMLALASGMLACALYLDGRRGSPAHSNRPLDSARTDSPSPDKSVSHGRSA